MTRVMYIFGLLLSLAIWICGSLAAQEVVLRGSTHRYCMTPLDRNARYAYSWAVTAGTSSAFGTDSLSRPILWDGPEGVYTVSGYPTDLTSGCQGNTEILSVRVIDFFIRWQGASMAVCSSWGNEYRNFSVGVECSESKKPWSFEYQVDNTTPVNMHVTGGTSLMLNLKGFINFSTSTAETHKIRLVGLSTPDGHQFAFDGSETEAASHLYTVTVNSAPPLVHLGQDTSVCSSEPLLLDAGNSGMWYEWSNGSLDQTIWAHAGDGAIWVKVTDANHCTGTDSINVYGCKSDGRLFVPNVFTPNGDGENDTWEIGGTKFFPEMTVSLFDRWGRLVFKSEPGYPKPWNGERNNQLLPMDAYFYIIDTKNGDEPQRGSVTLIQ